MREEKIAFKCILNLCFLFFHITQNAEFICDKNKILIGVKFKNKWVFGQIALENFKLNNFFSLFYNFSQPLMYATTRLFIGMCQYINELHAGEPMVGKNRNNSCHQ